MRKVKLIYPANIKKQSALYPPLGLAYISAFLKKENINCEVIDLTFDSGLNQIKNLTDKNAIYGISCTTALYNSAKEITKILKQVDPYGIVCLGGSHPTVLPEYVLSDDKNTDIIVIGEGEYTMADIAECCSEDEEVDSETLDSINGIYYRDREGKVAKTDKRAPIQNLDELPFPDQLSFPVEKYFLKKGFRELSMITSRGCPGDCTFCQPALRKIFGEKLRFRSAKNIVDEMEFLIKTFNLDMITFSDDTFTFSKKRTHEICQEIIDRNINILWRCQTRVDLDEETMRLMKRSGCFLMALGVESGSEKILYNIHKRIKLNEIKKTFNFGRKIGILTFAYLMVGNEGETGSTIEDTLDLIEQIKPFSGNVSITTPYPGTHLYEHMTLKINDDWSRYVHFSEDTPTLNLSTLSHERLIKGKKAIEEAIKKESRKTDIIRLMKDLTILKIMLRTSLRNKSFTYRMGRLLATSLLKQGFQITNPNLNKKE